MKHSLFEPVLTLFHCRISFSPNTIYVTTKKEFSFVIKKNTEKVPDLVSHRSLLIKILGLGRTQKKKQMA